MCLGCARAVASDEKDQEKRSKLLALLMNHSFGVCQRCGKTAMCVNVPSGIEVRLPPGEVGAAPAG